MNVQSPTQKLVVGIVVLVVIGLAIAYVLMSDSGRQTPAPAPLTPEQKQQVLDSLEPRTPTSGTMTTEQKKALDTLGTEKTSAAAAPKAKQSSNTPAQEKSILDSLQGK